MYKGQRFHSALLMRTLIVLPFLLKVWRQQLLVSMTLWECHTSHSRVYFSASEICVLNAAIASVAENVTRISFDPRENVRLRSQADIIADLKCWRDDLLLRRQIAKNFCEWEFGPARVESSAVDDPVSRKGVRISSIVEVDDVEFWPDEPHDPYLLGKRNDISSPGKGKKRRKISSLLHTKKKVPLAASPSVSPRKRVNLYQDASFVAALDKSFERTGTRKSWRDLGAAPKFEMSRRSFRLFFICICLFAMCSVYSEVNIRSSFCSSRWGLGTGWF